MSVQRQSPMNLPDMSDQEFSQFQTMIYDIAGISLSPAKKPLVSGRLAKRVKHQGFGSYGEYFRALTREHNGVELQVAVDLLTTNETHFFREPRHFDFLRERILPQHAVGKPFRVWSAASSSGQEPYSIAMTLADCLGDAAWEVTASDISTRVLETAQGGLYPIEQSAQIPKHYLSSYCLKGIGTQAGSFMIDSALRSRVRIMQINLNQTLPKLGVFDLIFLRNVMIYFDTETKRQVVGRIAAQLKPGGYLLIGHSESLNGVVDQLQAVMPSVYRKP